MITLTFTLEHVGEKAAVKITPKWDSPDDERNEHEAEAANRINGAIKLVAAGNLGANEIQRRLRKMEEPKIVTNNNKILCPPKPRF